MAGYSKKARRNASIARSIKSLLGKAAYEAYKRTGHYDASALEAARKKATEELDPQPAVELPPLPPTSIEPAVEWAKKLPLDLYLVGGAIRDEVMGRTPKDADFLAAGVGIEGLKAALPKDVGVEDLTVADQLVGLRVHIPEIADTVEIAPPRIEVSTGPRRDDFEIRPDANASVEDDLERRDFTVNAIARSLATGEVIDPYNGTKDAEDRVLRTISDDSFRDDPLRILRGLARISKDGLTPTKDTEDQMREFAPRLTNVSGDRKFDELNKVFDGTNAPEAFRIARDTGVLQELMPELVPMIGFEQESKYHDMTVDEHTFSVLEAAIDRNAPKPVLWAILFHDAGKPESAWRGPEGRLHYYANPEQGKEAHEEIAARMVDSIAEKIRLPRKLQNDVRYIVANHMFQDHSGPTPIKARKFLRKHGLDKARMLIAHKRADMSGKGEEQATPEAQADLDMFEAYVEANREQPYTTKALAINGNDLIAMGIEPGRDIGAILEELLNQVVANPSLNNREWLLRNANSIAKRLVSTAV